MSDLRSDLEFGHFQAATQHGWGNTSERGSISMAKCRTSPTTPTTVIQGARSGVELIKWHKAPPCASERSSDGQAEA
jgi:hypothetical protein